MRWTKKLANQYLVLSNHGKLYYGAEQDSLEYLMDNVDAVEWSVKGNFVAAARNNTLSILSSKFKQKFSMSLSFKSWVGDCDMNSTVRVDCIRWVRPDCIILGCFQLTADGEEQSYLVQVITSKDGKIADASFKPVVLSFSDMYEGVIDDILPFGSGPYMCLCYLDRCELAISTNRKSTDQHIVLLSWLDDGGEKEPAVIDILRDTLCPKIALQGNGDDNMVLGLCVDKMSHHDTVEVKLGAEYKELSPFCVLMCVSFDGKLFMFQVASLSGAPAPSDNVSCLSDEEDDTPAVELSEDVLSKLSSGWEKNVQEVSLHLQNQEVIKKKQVIKDDMMSHKETIPGNVSPVNLQTFKSNGPQNLPVIKLNEDIDDQQSLLTGQQAKDLGQLSLKLSCSEVPGPVVKNFSKIESQKHTEGEYTPDPSCGKFLKDSCRQPISVALSEGVGLHKEFSGKLGSASYGGCSFLPHNYIQSNQTDYAGKTLGLAPVSDGSNGNFSQAEAAVGQPTAFYSSGKTVYGGEHHISTHIPLFSSQQNLTLGKTSKDELHPNKDNYRTASPTRQLNSEPRLSKQFGNVEEMINELEALLERIEGTGGFIDACTIVQNSSLLALEEGLRTVFGRCRQLKSLMDKQMGEIQLLLDNTVQVLARRIYMEGIIKQATDGQYWDLWNSRELNSELDIQRCHILKINQELANQLIELERYLNAIELNKFGKNVGLQKAKRAYPSRGGPLRDVQSLYSLHNTMNSQLAAAKHLSDCLSKQLALLSMEPPSVERQNVRRELFEEIGISYTSASFCSPDEKDARLAPSHNKLLKSSCSDNIKIKSRRNQSSVMMGCESETVRRRRNSLDPSWVSFEPPKTTVKRMFLHESRQRAAPDRPSLIDKKHVEHHKGVAAAHLEHHASSMSPLYTSEEKGIQDRPIKQASEIPWQSAGLKSSLTQLSPVSSFSMFQSQSVSMPSTNSSQNNVKADISENARRSSGSAIVMSKSDSFSVDESIQKYKTDLHQNISISKKLLRQLHCLTKEPSEMSKSNCNETTPFESTIESLEHSHGTIENPFTEPWKGVWSPVSPASAIDPDPNNEASKSQLHGIALSFDTTSDSPGSAVVPDTNLNIENKSQSSKITSPFSATLAPTSSLLSPIVQSPSLVASSLPNLTAPTSSLAISASSSSMSSEASINISQTALPSQLSNSYAILSGSYVEVSEKPSPSPSLSLSPVNLKTESPVENPESPVITHASVTKESSSIEALPPSEPESAFSGKLESSEPSALAFDSSSNMQSGSKQISNGVAINSKADQLFATNVVSAALTSSSGSASGRKSENSDVVVTRDQEDEMEEEAPETIQTTELTLGSLGGFGIGSVPPNSIATKPNPFGVVLGTSPAPAGSLPFSMAVPTGELFRPASFSFQSPQPASQPSQLTAFSGGISTGTTFQNPTGSGFGKPAQIGSGQQALGSVLGAFGQSRQLGVLPAASASSPGFSGGGLMSSHSISGFASISSSGGGGFASLASGGGGFGGLVSAGGGFATASSGGGGFAAVASGGGGFAATAISGGGFAAAAATSGGGGGFTGAASGGGFPSSGGVFGAFNNPQGSGGFSAFGGSGATGTGRPPPALFTQMRK
ncbi:hypothetical protein NMG60_11033081 [Bertholletia excelsa]